MTVPTTLAEATSAEWIGSILGADIVRVTVGTVDERISTNTPILVELADGSRRELWIKGYFSDVGRAFRRTGIPEAVFYRKLSGWVGVRTLRPVHAEFDPDTGANVVVTEDVAKSGARFLNSLSPYSASQAAESLGQLARLHSATWMHAIGNSPWLEPRLLGYTIARGVGEIRSNFEGETGAGIPAEVREPERLYAAYKVVATDAATAAPWAIVHGDPHIGNLFLDAAGRPTFVDWQLVQRGPWYLDVGYHMVSALTVRDRRDNEQDLVRHYLACLGERGIEPPKEGEVWKGLRRSFVHGFYLWAITLKVDPKIRTALLERLGTAVSDHDAFEEVGF